MGLDVYLYTRAQHEHNEAYDKSVDELYARTWDSDDQRREALAALPKYQIATDSPSLRDPEHLFNRRYLRSSYNSGGFNNAVPELIDQPGSLYWIFEALRPEDGWYELVVTPEHIPALEEAKARALHVAAELRNCQAPLRVTTVAPILGEAEHMWREPPTADEALTWFKQEKERQEREPGRFEPPFWNAKGLIRGFDTGLDVLGVTVGKDILGAPSAHLIYREGKDSMDYLALAAEIVAEFCDEAIELTYRDLSCVIHWSA